MTGAMSVCRSTKSALGVFCVNQNALGDRENRRIYGPKPCHTLAFCWCLGYASRKVQLSCHPAQLKKRTCWVLQAPIKSLSYLNMTIISFWIIGWNKEFVYTRKTKPVLFKTAVINRQSCSTSKNWMQCKFSWPYY